MSQAKSTKEPAAQEASVGPLDQLNAYRYKPFVKLGDLEQHVAHKIYAARRITTKFGERVVLELFKYQLFLPARFDNLSDDVINNINKEANYYLTNQGPVGASHDIVFSQHDILENYATAYLGPNSFYNDY